MNSVHLLNMKFVLFLHEVCTFTKKLYASGGLPSNVYTSKFTLV